MNWKESKIKEMECECLSSTLNGTVSENSVDLLSFANLNQPKIKYESKLFEPSERLLGILCIKDLL